MIIEEVADEEFEIIKKGLINIELWSGGTLVHQPGYKYIGGSSVVHKGIYLKEINRDRILQWYERKGGKKQDVQVYYCIGESVRQINGNVDMLEFQKEFEGVEFAKIYIEELIPNSHNELVLFDNTKEKEAADFREQFQKKKAQSDSDSEVIFLGERFARDDQDSGGDDSIRYSGGDDQDGGEPEEEENQPEPEGNQGDFEAEIEEEADHEEDDAELEEYEDHEDHVDHEETGQDSENSDLPSWVMDEMQREYGEDSDGYSMEDHVEDNANQERAVDDESAAEEENQKRAADERPNAGSTENFDVPAETVEDLDRPRVFDENFRRRARDLPIYHEKDDPVSVELMVGMQFRTVAEFRVVLRDWAVRHGHDLEFVKNESKRVTCRCKYVISNGCT